MDEKSHSQEKKAKYSNRYPFSGKIQCGRCGTGYAARYKTRKDGSQYKAWCCFERVKHGKPYINKAGDQMGCFGESIRNEEVIYIIALVCRQLKIDYKKIKNNLIKIIQSVISIDLADTEQKILIEKINTIKKNHINLIELYINGEIDRNEFTILKAKYYAEAEHLKSIKENIKKQQKETEKQEEWTRKIKEIEKIIEELIGGILYEDEFYAKLIDKVVINNKENVDVYLNSLPFKWSAESKKLSDFKQV